MLWGASCLGGDSWHNVNQFAECALYCLRNGDKNGLPTIKKVLFGDKLRMEIIGEQFGENLASNLYQALSNILKIALQS